MLDIRGVTLHYDGHVALASVSLTVGQGEVLAILGPSGSGKSSLLRVIAGLEVPTDGSVELDGRTLDAVATHERNVGLMFQDYALFPHLDVAGNVGFGLRMRGDQTTDQRVGEVLEWVGLAGFGDRAIETLSGGEQQRVALARAVAPVPAVMMLDEPVGALDRALRTRLVPELAGLLRSLGVPTLYVTHDQEEAFAIADRVAVLTDGRLVQLGSPDELWRHPESEFVARFLGMENIADVRVAAGVATTPWGAISSALPDGDHRAVLRAEAVTFDDDGELVGTVAAATFVGGTYDVTVSCLDHAVHLTTIAPPPAVGTQVRLAVDADALHSLNTD